MQATWSEMIELKNISPGAPKPIPAPRWLIAVTTRRIRRTKVVSPPRAQ